MNHEDLTHMLAALTRTPLHHTELVVRVLADIIKKELQKGNHVQINNIGTFHVVDSNNMNTKKRVKLKAHAALKAAINEELNE